MRRGRLAITVLAAAAAVSAGPADVPSPDDLVRRGNEAFAEGDVVAADHWYDAAGERTGDPGLVAFNRAAVLFGKDEFREAEVHYLRTLADNAIPPERRVRALFNRGVCLLRRGGESTVYRSAIACFEQALDGPPVDPTLTADARHNLEVAKVLWNQAVAREKVRPRANDPLPEESLPEQTPTESPGGDPGSAGDDAGGQAKPELAAGPGSRDQGARATDRKAPGAGNLPVVSDADAVQPLSPEDTRALLSRAAERLEKDRKSTARLLAGPERANVRDW